MTSRDFAFDIFSSVSEAIHVNIIGYNPDHTLMKSADLYMWLGDGGGRDYSSLRRQEGPALQRGQRRETSGGHGLVLEAQRQRFRRLEPDPVGRVELRFLRRSPARASTAWPSKASAAARTFEISKDVYYEPFKTSVRGFFYMRIGEEQELQARAPAAAIHPGRGPAELPGLSHHLRPVAPRLEEAGRRRPGTSTDWSKYKEPGEPTNPNAWGGHSDACDWDRNPAHISIIWDLLLPYLLSNGKIGDDNLRDRRKRQRHPGPHRRGPLRGGLLAAPAGRQRRLQRGLNNPPARSHHDVPGGGQAVHGLGQRGQRAMLADCFRIAGKTDLMNQYRMRPSRPGRSPTTRISISSFGIGNGVIRGRDLKMMAAAFLYNVTGDRTYEDAMAKESVATSRPRRSTTRTSTASSGARRPI